MAGSKATRRTSLENKTGGEKQSKIQGHPEDREKGKH